MRVVVVFFDQIGVVHGDAGGRESTLVIDVVDPAGFSFVPTDHAQRGDIRQRNIEEAFQHMAVTAAADAVHFKRIAGGKCAGIWLVGDDLDGTGLRAGAVKRALRTGQCFHAFDVVDMRFDGAADAGDRLFIKIDADRGGRAGMVAVAAADNAADVRIGTAAFALRIGQAGQQFGVIIEIIDVHFGELLRSQDLDADRHFLQVFRTLLRGHGDCIKHGLLVFGRCLVIRGG